MQLGDYRVEIIRDTEFKLDGGAMFGVVPRVVWEQICPPDELNRVTLQTNCLFIDTGKEKVLIETGMGEKWTPRQLSMYGIERRRPFVDSLFETAQCRPEDITIVINTHLHFDHAGGNTIAATHLSEPPASAGGDLRGLGRAKAEHVPQFKNARYLVSKTELSHSEAPHERDRASYLSENWHPLIESRQLEVMPETYEPVDGLKVEQVRGHSETMQTIKLTCGGETIFGFFDMVPTRHHLKLPWIMSYDLYPTETLEFKKRLLPQALEENWICHFYHDVEMPLARLATVNEKLTAIGIH